MRQLENVSTEFFEQIRDAALITRNGRIVDANSAAEAQFGYSRDALVGMRVSKLLADPRDEVRFVKALARGPVTDFALRLRTSRGDVLECLVTATASCDENGRVTVSQGLARDVTEHNRVIAELRRAEQDYRGLFENAHDAILLLDLHDETILDANHRACVMYGFPREDLVGRSMVELSVNPERGRMMLRRTHEESGRYASFESEQRRRDGTLLNVEINAAEVSYKGRVAILTINRDVSTRRAAEEAIRASEERFRLLLESVTDYSIVMLDPAGRVVSWNEGAERITGYEADEVLGRSAAMFSGGDEEGLMSDLVVAASTKRLEREMERVRKDGSRFSASVTLTPIVDDTANLRGYAEITHDITASRRLEEEREELLRVLNQVATEWTATFDAVQVPIVLVDRDGEIRRLNRAAMSMAGLPFAELIHKRVDALPGEPWRTIERVGRTAFLQGRAETTRAVEGDSVWQVSASLSGANAHRAIVVAYDLTLLTRLETSLRRNEVAAALGSLVAGVAHEVRNPLFTISATLDAWEALYGGSDGLSRYAGSLRDQVDRLNRLMRDLLEYGKPHPLSFREMPVGEIVRAAAQCCAAAAEKQNVTVHLLIPDDLPSIALDPERMEQVFVNVLDNAIWHTRPDGNILVDVDRTDSGIVCRVIDEGCGLAPADLENAFVPMYTRRRGGTGLGLPIAHSIVAAHGGEITLRNREQGNGAIATIRLPFRKPTTASEPSPELRMISVG